MHSVIIYSHCVLHAYTLFHCSLHSLWCCLCHFVLLGGFLSEECTRILFFLIPPYTSMHCAPSWQVIEHHFIQHNGSLNLSLPPSLTHSPSDIFRRLFKVMDLLASAVLVVCTHPFILWKDNWTFEQRNIGRGRLQDTVKCDCEHICCKCVLLKS